MTYPAERHSITHNAETSEQERAAYERWAMYVWSPPESIPPLWDALPEHLRTGWVAREAKP